MRETPGVWAKAQGIVLGLLGKKACDEDPLAMSVATQVLVDFKMARACGCTNRRLCREHYNKARKLMGNPLEGVTIEFKDSNGEKSNG